MSLSLRASFRPLFYQKRRKRGLNQRRLRDFVCILGSALGAEGREGLPRPKFTLSKIGGMY